MRHKPLVERKTLEEVLVAARRAAEIVDAWPAWKRDLEYSILAKKPSESPEVPEGGEPPQSQ